jgi:hypothetical protein
MGGYCKRMKGTLTENTRKKATWVKTLVERYGQHKLYSYVFGAVKGKIVQLSKK